jgi:hypothetical protein
MRDTIDMAREVKATAYTNRHYPDRTTYTFGPEQLKAFVDLVRADEREETNRRANASWTLMCEKMVSAEREECARLADERLMDTSALLSMPPKSSAAWNIATAIRARGETK